MFSSSQSKNKVYLYNLSYLDLIKACAFNSGLGSRASAECKPQGSQPFTKISQKSQSRLTRGCRSLYCRVRPPTSKFNILHTCLKYIFLLGIGNTNSTGSTSGPGLELMDMVSNLQECSYNFFKHLQISFNLQIDNYLDFLQAEKA